MRFPRGHAGYVILLVMLGISGDIKPTWRGLIAALLFDAGRFIYHQIKFHIFPDTEGVKIDFHFWQKKENVNE